MWALYQVSWWGYFPWTQFLQIFGRCIWKSAETTRLRGFSSPIDWMREVVFCKVPWGLILVNFSSNFTKITLYRQCFPLCLPHDCPSFQGHLCLVAEWIQCNVFNKMFSPLPNILIHSPNDCNTWNLRLRKKLLFIPISGFILLCIHWDTCLTTILSRRHII